MARYAYADPPYPGQAKRHYTNDPSGITAAEVDHAALISRLCDEYPDGWALSTSSSALKYVLSLCPDDVRTGPWCKNFGIMKPAVNPGYLWEALIWRGGRKRRSRKEPTVRDWLVTPVTIKRGTHGAKPDPFAYGLFDVLGMRLGDTLDELYPGSRAVSRAWHKRQTGLWTPLGKPSHAQVRLIAESA